ncbi:MAG: hypothetical protein ACI9CB_002150 [Rhodothermales bacterium]
MVVCWAGGTAFNAFPGDGFGGSGHARVKSEGSEQSLILA